MPSEFKWPVDENGYRACSVCMQSVDNTVWSQIPKVRIAFDGRWAVREWDEEPHLANSIGGPVLHLKCVETYLEGLRFEFEQKIKREASDELP